MSFCNKCGAQTKLDCDMLCDGCMGKVIASCKCGNCSPPMSMLGPTIRTDTARNPIVEINESGGSLTGDSARLRANGVAIEPGPAVSLQSEPVPGGQRVGTIADLVRDCEALGREVPKEEWEQFHRDLQKSRSVKSEDIEWDGTSLVPPYEQPSVETLLRALEFKFKEQAAELRAMRLKLEKLEEP